MTTTIPTDDYHPRITTRHRLAAGPGGGGSKLWTDATLRTPPHVKICLYEFGGL